MNSSAMPTIFDIFAQKKDDIEFFKEKEVIFEQGQMGDVMYCILAGKVNIIFNNQIINTHEAGEIFGEMALIDTKIRSASAVARTDCELVGVNERKFIFLTQQHPFFALYIMRILAERLRKRTEAD